MAVHRLYFAGRCSLDFGLHISGEGTFSSPALEYETVDIPGRPGSLVLSGGFRLKNVSVTYPGFILSDFKRNMDALRLWLFSQRGYQRLEDDYNPETYRMAMYAGPVEPTPRFLNSSGEVELTFDCQPQRWLKSGERPTALTSGAVLHNIGMTALPLLELTGTGAGTLSVGSVTVSISEIGGALTIDSATQNAYSGTLNKNGVLTLNNGAFPSLPPGDTPITFSGGITSCKITPRWWTV